MKKSEEATDTQRDQDSHPRLVRFSVDDLKAFAGARCRDIFNDFTEEEATRQPRSVFLAWEVGRDLFLHEDYTANAKDQAAP
jgi:hypothetical protein